MNQPKQRFGRMIFCVSASNIFCCICASCIQGGQGVHARIESIQVHGYPSNWIFEGSNHDADGKEAAAASGASISFCTALRMQRVAIDLTNGIHRYIGALDGQAAPALPDIALQDKLPARNFNEANPGSETR